MRFKKQAGFTTQPEASQMSKTKTLFVDNMSSSRRPLASNDALVHGDITGICALLLAKGHSRRLYGMISDVKIVS